MATKTREGADTQSAPDDAAEVAKRLVVELTKRASQDMAWLVNEEEANKTTIVNRAVQVYKMVVEAQGNGQRLMIGNSDGSNAQILYLV